MRLEPDATPRPQNRANEPRLTTLGIAADHEGSRQIPELATAYWRPNKPPAGSLTYSSRPEIGRAVLSAQVARWPGETVLTGRDGEQLSPWALERAIRAARRQVDGLPDGFRYHDLRHYLASLLIADGADVKTMQARLRHASAKTTLDTYGHLWPDRDESTRATIEAVFAGRTELSRNADDAR
jgi:integrase